MYASANSGMYFISGSSSLSILLHKAHTGGGGNRLCVGIHKVGVPRQVYLILTVRFSQVAVRVS